MEGSFIEYWDLFDRNRNHLERKAVRGEKLKYNKFHPLMWECTGGSALLGESSINAAIREVKD